MNKSKPEEGKKTAGISCSVSCIFKCDDDVYDAPKKGKKKKET